MSLSSPFIERPIATSLMMFTLLFSGFLAYRFLAVAALPQVEYPTIQISTFYPGASPEVMASSVTAPLEKQFGQMAGLAQMISNSSTGSSIVTLQFNLDLSLDIAEQAVQEAINASMTYLPADLPNPPVYNKINPADTPILTLALTSKSLMLPDIEDYADTRLGPRIAQLPGVGLVSISGGQRPAVRIQANPDALSAYGLTLEGLRTLIENSNVNSAKGSFDGPRLAYTINANDQLFYAKDYSPLIVAYQNNAPVRVSDIAHVIDSAENVRQAAWMNKQPTIILNIKRQPGANVIQVVDKIKTLLNNLSSQLPTGINITILSDRTQSIRASIADVFFELLLAVLLVILVIYVFLHHLPATIIPSISVPVSLIGTVSVMYLFNFSINNLTLMALTIATGFVVDDAIVMIENISRYIEQGETPINAALKGSAQIGFTILSLTFSLIAVLIPLLFMSDVIGRLFREFAITLSATLLLSAFISLTLTPMLCSRLLRHQTWAEMHTFARTSITTLQTIVSQYKTSLSWVLNHQPLIIIIFLTTLILTGALFYLIPKSFFPSQDTGGIQGISIADQSISFPAMALQQQQLTSRVLADPAVANISSFIGIDGTNYTLNSGRMLITLKPLNQRDSVDAVIARLQRALKQVPLASLYLQPIQDLTLDTQVSTGQYQFALSSPLTADIEHWTPRLLNKLRESPLLRNVNSNMQNKGLVTRINVDRDMASQLGITMAMIDNTLYDAFGQRQISIIFTHHNQYRVILEAFPKLQQGRVALENIYINSASGGSVPLRTFAQFQQTTGPLLITHLNQFPSSTVSFNLAPHVSLGDALQEITQIQQSLHLPEKVQGNFLGSAQIFANSLSNEVWLLLAAIVVVYIVLGILYESYIHPLTILSTLPSACMGALLALFLTKHDLTLIALIGIILLIGLVMKNAIIMIDFALEQERVYGKSPLEAISEAAALRFRPIIMTTMASMLGAVPLAFGTGMGAELRNPLGIVIIAGLIISQLLTLYTTPIIYLVFDGLSRKWVTWVSHRTHPARDAS